MLDAVPWKAMKDFAWILLLAAIYFYRVVTEVDGASDYASIPPRGWNSYDSFSWVIDEQAFLHNAEIMADRLHQFGYEYAVVDFLWYRKNVEGAPFDSFGNDHIDQWGRPYPDPERWPSSEGGKGFTEVASKVHELGLKFGIHLMRGISTQAVSLNTPILDVNTGAAYEESGQKWSAKDVGMTDRTCAWLKKGFMSVLTDSGAGKAFLRSLYHQYAEWGVDFVKLDCVFGDDFDSKEIITVSEILEELERPVVFSISPGTRAIPSMADIISNRVNMYRITGDDWDNWEAIASHFNASRDFAAAKKIGAEGLHGKSWPDLDMLPFGWLTDPNANIGPHRKCNLTPIEQKSQMTLWCMAKSPLIYGGDLRHLDLDTYNLITHPTLLEINSYSANNMEFPHVSAKKYVGIKHYVRSLMTSSEDVLDSPKVKLPGLTRCGSELATGWSCATHNGQSQICWNYNMKSISNHPFCFRKKGYTLALDEDMPYNQQYPAKFQLLAKYVSDACLEAASGRKLRASETEGTSFTRCKRHATQIWRLNNNGTLVNSYSGMCATMNSRKDAVPWKAMKDFAWILLLAAIYFYRVVTEVDGASDYASIPPRGWNSYDSFSWVIDEQAFLHNAEIMADRLHQFGYEYAVVDFLWYRKNVEGAPFDSFGNDHIDQWGRPYPDPERWPSSEGGKGFTEVASKVHELGLKFGIHLMRGISTQAVSLNTPILDVNTGAAYEESGQKWSAKDVGMTDRTCAWLKKGFMSVLTDSGAGKAFLRSLYHQYAEWGVDFVKLDCVFGDDFDSKEIITVSEILEELERPVVFSISPGTRAIPSMADIISNRVNMYRITGDDWDNWEAIASHFNASRDFAAAKKIGAEGLHGKSWPDLDMLPFGWLTDPNANIGPHRKCNLTPIEQKSQMTLWCMAKSPLIYGGDLRHLDLDTYNLITHPTLLEINSYSANNMEFPHVSAKKYVGIKHYVRSLMTSSEDVLDSPKVKLPGLTRCGSELATGWSCATHNGQSQICWNYNMKSISNHPFCFRKKGDEDMPYNQQYPAKFQLLAKYVSDACLEAASGRKLRASETEGTSFTRCKRHATQIWRLNNNGTLVNSYSGMCATMNSRKAVVADGGTRSWIATGRKGEIYLSFFNLNSVMTVMSAKISDVTKAVDNVLPYRGGPCNCTEIWSRKDLGKVNRTLSLAVESHGVALFVLNCM